MFGNLIYFSHINSIGGIETWLYNLSVLYKDRDITLIYKTGAMPQINRISQNIRCIKWDGAQTFECKELLICFNREIIPFIKADRISMVLHGDYLDMVKRKQLTMSALPIDERIDRYIGVSAHVCDSWKELTGIDAQLCYNPNLPVKQNRVVRLCSAQRLTREKGGQRIRKLANALEQLLTDDKWVWDIFTDSKKEFIHDNVRFFDSRQDITDFYSGYDWFVALSDNEGYCYSVVEALMRGVPCCVTDIPVFNELGLDDSNSIRLNLDCSNIDEVALHLMTDKKSFEYRPRIDNWGYLFTNDASTYIYKEDAKVMLRVVALDTYQKRRIKDSVLNKILPAGYEFEVTEERLAVLLGNNPYKVPFVKIKEKENTENNIEEKVIEEKAKETPKKRGRKKKE